MSCGTLVSPSLCYLVTHCHYPLVGGSSILCNLIKLTFGHSSIRTYFCIGRSPRFYFRAILRSGTMEDSPMSRDTFRTDSIEEENLKGKFDYEIVIQSKKLVTAS